METLLESFVRSPKLVLYNRHIRSLLSEERRRRKQFYEDITEQQKAEFINGEIIVHSPVKLEHEFASTNLMMLLRSYVMLHKIGYVGHEKMMISLTRNDYEPDVCFWSSKKSAKFKPKQMKFPAPDFIAEVLSPPTRDIDRTVKLEDYEAHGVKEYWIIDPGFRSVEQYVLKRKQYQLEAKAESEILKSQAVKGFEIYVGALFDENEHLKALRKLWQESESK